jgi:hypothetical protein
MALRRNNARLTLRVARPGAVIDVQKGTIDCSLRLCFLAGVGPFGSVAADHAALSYLADGGIR